MIGLKYFPSAQSPVVRSPYRKHPTHITVQTLSSKVENFINVTIRTIQVVGRRYQEN